MLIEINKDLAERIRKWKINCYIEDEDGEYIYDDGDLVDDAEAIFMDLDELLTEAERMNKLIKTYDDK